MGRRATSQTNVNDRNRWGRDHHISGYSVWLAGGGITGGMAYGATDELRQAVGRDFRLTDLHGNVVREIVS